MAADAGQPREHNEESRIRDFYQWTDGMQGSSVQLHRFRHRAHANPLNDVGFAHPSSSTDLDLHKFFTSKTVGPVTTVDIGCGYGDLLMELARLPSFRNDPNEFAMGLEIRSPATRIAQQQVIDERQRDPQCQFGAWDRIAFMRCNVMKNVTQCFPQYSLSRVFCLFGDPQFKNSHVRRRIVSPGLLDDYSSLMKENARFYVATDVPALFDWEVSCLMDHPAFVRASEEEEMNDPLIPIILTKTADADRADRKGRDR